MTAAEVLAAHWLESARLEPVARGLINETFLVTAGRRYALQRVSAIFDPAIHENIEAVTARLEELGLSTPRLVRTRDGRLFARFGDEIWRLMTWVDGHTFEAARSAGQIRAAARLVGRFHRALDDFDHAFVGRRLGVHDTGAHLTRLERAVAEHPRHRLIEQVEPLAAAILAAARELSALPELPDRVCHGDLKLSNLVFEGATPPESERAVALVDLDTVGPMALAHELGDALRSWCNPRREDDPPVFDLDLMRAAVAGYAEGVDRLLTRAERRAILVGVEHISLELSARFAADALREEYFGYDERRFAARGEHNLVRARGQWALHRDLVATRAPREAAVG
jgi:Ser/Thr protein kinase RdoA (MazF antagonist)